MKKLLLIASLCVLFGACNRKDHPQDSDLNTDYRCPRNSSYSDNEENPDWQITTRVKTAIATDGGVSGSARFVSVKTDDGVVTLTGTVSSKEESRYIERKVRSVSGVRQVNNQLTINP
jgi:hyperosmotically inducible protein